VARTMDGASTGRNDPRARRARRRGRRTAPEPSLTTATRSAGALVVREWGDDIVASVGGVSGVRATQYDEGSRWYGLRGPMKDVLVSRRR
jgi:hypothetical protein